MPRSAAARSTSNSKYRRVTGSSRDVVLRELQQIPGVGKSIADDLWEMGIQSVAALKNKSPERLYLKHCSLKGSVVDRCMLYVLRCAVYYASHPKHNPALLKWWNWKDR